MGMSNINISFTEKSATVVKRGARGIVALILREEAIRPPLSILTVEDVPEVSPENKEQIKLALLGYQNTPKKVIAYFIEKDAGDYDDALEFFEVTRFDYLVIPTVETDGKTLDIVSWIKAQRQNGKKCKAVLPNTPGDNEGIINYTTSSAITDKTSYTAEKYCSRIAGMIAGTPLTISCTFAPLPELSDCTRLKKEDMDKAVDKGEFIIFYDGEKVKVGRGVNSLVTTTQDKGYQFTKIKIIETVDMIFDDLKKATEDSYLGKFANSYDNKCLLISAIQGYFSQLILDGILSSARTEVNIPAQRKYLKEKGIDVDAMGDDEIKTADTGDKVFVKASLKILDAIEEIDLPITI